MPRLLENRMLWILAVSMLVLTCTPEIHAQPATGGPPQFPIARVKPRLWEPTIKADVFASSLYTLNTSPLSASRSEIIVPVIIQGAYSKVDPSSIKVAGQINGQTYREGDVPWKLRGPHPDGTAEIVVEFVDIKAQSIGVKVTWLEQSWLALVDDAAALQITWPVEWPEEIRKYLKPSPWIESEDEFITDFVQRITQGNLRKVTPYAAAKELLRETITRFRSINGTGNERRDLGLITGLQLVGAVEAARAESGSPNDLVCTCVAVLRAAGIPSRPVVGIVKELGDNLRERTRWRTWAEFYLPRAGWVAFDPNEMRGSGFQFKAIDVAWPGLGDVDDLDKRMPVAYDFQPKGTSMEWQPVWGWVYTGSTRDIYRLFSQTSLTRVSRGQGVPDP